MSGVEMRVPGAVASVSAEAIERNLTQLWREIAEPGELMPVRASVLNLIVFADSESARYALLVLANLPGRHTSRIIVLIPSRGDRNRLSTDVAAHCDRLGSDGRRICHEQVTIRFGADAVGLLPGLITPLIVPDLPVVLWIPGRGPTEDTAIAWLTGLADRIILDSAVYQRAETLLGGAELLAADPERSAILGDLNWHRIGPWRRAVMKYFEPPEFKPFAQGIERIVLTYRGDEHQPVAPHVWLLAGWLISRLQWQPSDGLCQPGAVRWTLVRPDGAPAELHVQADASGEAEAGHAAAVELTARHGGEVAVFQTVRLPGRDIARTVMAIGDRVARQCIVRLEIPGDAELLAAELNQVGRDVAYERAMARAAALCRLLEAKE